MVCALCPQGSSKPHVLGSFLLMLCDIPGCGPVDKASCSHLPCAVILYWVLLISPEDLEMCLWS